MRFDFDFIKKFHDQIKSFRHKERLKHTTTMCRPEYLSSTISGSHGGKYEEESLLGYSAI
jgi:hypothetical protein